MGGRAQLSPREAECLRLVLELRTSKAIARRLTLQSGSVDKYLQAAARKLGASNRFDAAALLWQMDNPGRTIPPIGISQSAGMAADVLYDQIGPDRSGDGPPPVSEAREAPSTYAAPPMEPAEDVSPGIPLPRAEGRRNDLSGQERLALYIRYGVTVLLAFSAFCVSLLVVSAAYHELRPR